MSRKRGNCKAHSTGEGAARQQSPALWSQTGTYTCKLGITDFLTDIPTVSRDTGLEYRGRECREGIWQVNWSANTNGSSRAAQKEKGLCTKSMVFALSELVTSVTSSKGLA